MSLLPFQGHVLHWSQAPLSFQAWHNEETKGVLSLNYSIFHARKTYHDIQEHVTVQKTRHFQCLDSGDAPTCLTEVNTHEIPQSGKQNIFTISVKQLCTAMLLTNLATPQWLQLRCSKRTVSSLVCLQKNKTDSYSETTNNSVCKTRCQKLEVKFGNFCLSFTAIKPRTKLIELSSVYKTTATRSFASFPLVSFLKVVFRASNLLHWNLIVSGVRNNENILFLQKRWTTIATAYSPFVGQIDATQVLPSSPTSFPQKHTAFQIQTGEYISNYFLCNSQSGKKSHKQHLGCSKMCPNNNTRSECHCAPLFFVDRQDRCQSFISNKTEFDNVIINSDLARHLQNDMSHNHVSGLHTELTAPGEIATKTAIFSCNNMTHTQSSYKVSDVCIYRLDSENMLVPCTHGSHLQECKYFDCPLHFKCPNYFCLPWGRVCDGKWDCPQGYDEGHIINCSTRVCTDMLKCTISSLCVHLNDICNDFVDCPFRDDELQCDLLRTICPETCACLNYAIWCENTTFQESWNLKYVSYHITFSNVSVLSVQGMLQSNGLHLVNLSHNALAQVCFAGCIGRKTKLLDLSDNNVTHIESNCFHSLSQIFLITLKRNYLSHLEPFSINNISSSFSLDLSDNNLTDLSKYSITNATNILYLLLVNNPMKNLEMKALEVHSIYLIQGNHHSICCNHIAVRCTSTKVGSCRDLLPTSILKTLFPPVYVCVLGFNTLSITTNIFAMWKQHSSQICPRNKPKKRAWPYNLIVSSIHVTDILYGVYLLIIWYGDLLYRSTYAINKSTWTNSILCSLAIIVILVFSILSPLLAVYLSLSRFVVVKYPFSWTCKSVKFTYKILLVLVSGVLFCTAVIDTIFQIMCESVMGLCLPFAHPEYASCPFITFITLFVAVVLVSAVLLVATVHIAICLILKESKQISKGNASNIYNVTLQMILLSVSTTSSWIPSSLIFSISLFLHNPSNELLVWTVVLILPLNCVVNPIVVSFFLLRQGAKTTSLQ